MHYSDVMHYSQAGLLMLPQRAIREVVLVSILFATMSQRVQLEENTPEAEDRDDRERRKTREIETLDEESLPATDKQQRLNEIFERYRRDQAEADELARRSDWKNKPDAVKRLELQELAKRQRHVHLGR